MDRRRSPQRAAQPDDGLAPWDRHTCSTQFAGWVQGRLARPWVHAIAPAPGKRAEPPDEREGQQPIEAMGGDPACVALLVESLGLTPESVSSMLLNLELKGQVAARRRWPISAYPLAMPRAAAGVEGLNCLDDR